MPKIGNKPTKPITTAVPSPRPAPTPVRPVTTAKLIKVPPRDARKEYATVPCPESTFNESRHDLLNLQSCICGHDRRVHDHCVGEGNTRRLITDVPCGGQCRVKVGGERCGCRMFVFAKNTSPEGKRRYEEEKRRYPKVPPKEK